MATVCETIDAIERDGQESYRAIVKKLASGSIPAPASVRRALADSGKDFYALRDDVATLVERQRAAARLDSPSALVRAQARRLLVTTADPCIDETIAPFQTERRRLQILIGGIGDFRPIETIRREIAAAVEKLGIMAGPSGGETVLDGDSDAVGLLKIRITRLRSELAKAQQCEAESAEPRQQLAEVERQIVELETSKLAP